MLSVVIQYNTIQETPCIPQKHPIQSEEKQWVKRGKNGVNQVEHGVLQSKNKVNAEIKLIFSSYHLR